MSVAVPLQQLRASLAKDSFSDFFKMFWHVTSEEELSWNWHIGYICDEMQEVMERVFARKKKEYDLIINVPPGTSKSSMASILAVPWCWTRMPELQSINCSFDHGLSLDLALKSRRVVESELYRELFPHILPSPDQWTKGYFRNSQGGYRFATSTQGGVTGRHGHVITTDDSMDPMSSYSEAELKAINRWLKEVLSQRKVSKANTPTITIQQRVNELDETGFRLTMKKAKIFHICLPAELQENVNPPELKKNYVNGLLDPVRLSPDVLGIAREELGQYGYAGQFDQSPTPLAGGMFKVDRLKRGPCPPLTSFRRIVRFWDKAGTKDGGAYTVGVKMGEIFDQQFKMSQFWILDVVRAQLDTAEREDMIASVARTDGYDTIVGLEQEPGSGGKDSTNFTVRRLAGYVVKILNPSSEGDKVRRADPFSVQVNNGNVYVPENVEWFDSYSQELRFFPVGKFKDQVDGSSGGFIVITRLKKRIGVL